MSQEVEVLDKAWSNFIVPLRMKDGIDDGAYAELVSALRQCAEAWRTDDVIPRRGANILVDIVPQMQTFAESYGEEMEARLLDQMYALQELVWDCVALNS